MNRDLPQEAPGWLVGEFSTTNLSRIAANPPTLLPGRDLRAAQERTAGFTNPRLFEITLALKAIPSLEIFVEKTQMKNKMALATLVAIGIAAFICTALPAQASQCSLASVAGSYGY